MTGAVTYVSAFPGIYAFSFFMLSIVLIDSQNTFSWKIPVLIFLLTIGVFLKEVGVVMVLFVVLYSILFKNQSYLIRIFTFLVPLSIYAFFRFTVVKEFKIPVSDVPTAPTVTANFFERAITIPKMISFYLYTFLTPIHQSVNQQWVVKQINFVDFWGPLLFDLSIMIPILALGIYLYQKKSVKLLPYLFFLAILFIGIGIFMQIIPLEMTVAGRWFYTPMFGLLGIIGIAMTMYLTKYPTKTKLVYAFIIILLCIYAGLTIKRNFDWKSDVTLFSHDAHIANHTNITLELNAGSALYAAGKYDEALEHIDYAVELDPNRCLTYITQAYIYEGKKDLENAKDAYKHAIQINPLCEGALLNYSTLIAYTENPIQARDYVLRLMQRYPENVMLKAPLAIAEYRIGDKEHARTLILELYEQVHDPYVEKLYNAIMKSE
jgi:hypothetical protein